MPRGQETQVPPQEEGENTREIKESTSEAQRDAEMVSEPEAAVERERPIEESEAIEAELKTAVEAMPLIPAPEIKDGEEISVLPVPIPTDPPLPGKDEVSLSSVPIPNPPDRPENEISATPINTPGGTGEVVADLTAAEAAPTPEKDDDPQPPPDTRNINGEPKSEDGEVGETILDENSFKFFTPMPEEGARADIEAEPTEEILDEVSFKVETPLPEEQTGEGVAAEVDEEILDEASFKFFSPVPDEQVREAIEAKGEAEGENEILDENAFKPIPAQEGAEEDAGAETGEGTEEGGSILIGEEEGELEQVDLTAEAAKDVDEYWEPPELYAYEDSDGNIFLVDSQGNPIESPPNFKVDPNDYSVQAWYQGADAEKAFTVNKFPGYNSSDIFAYHAPDGTISLVDKDGNLIPSPPTINSNDIPGGNVSVKVYHKGTISFEVIKEYVPTTSGIYAYKTPEGTIDIVDEEGNPIKCPPHFYQDGSDPNIYLKMEGEKPIIIPEYVPTLEGIYLYQAQDGSYSVVDKDGKQVKSPPHLVLDGTTTPHINGEEGKVIEIKAYQPPTTEIYAYTAQDGSVYLVDKDGNHINSPPHYDVDQGTGKTYTKAKDDSAIEIKTYQAPISDMYIHLNQDGSINIVDENGKMINSPPNVAVNYDSFGKPIYMAKYAGMPLESSVQLNYYKPPSSHWDKK